MICVPIYIGGITPKSYKKLGEIESVFLKLFKPMNDSWSLNTWQPYSDLPGLPVPWDTFELDLNIDEQNEKPSQRAQKHKQIVACMKLCIWCKSRKKYSQYNSWSDSGKSNSKHKGSTIEFRHCCITASPCKLKHVRRCGEMISKNSCASNSRFTFCFVSKW